MSSGQKAQSKNPGTQDRGRAAQNRKIRRDALREELGAREYIRQLHAIAEQLTRVWMTLTSLMRSQAPKHAPISTFASSTSASLNLRPVDLPAPIAIEGEGAGEQARSVIDAVKDGTLSIKEATDFLNVLASVGRIQEFEEFAQRLEKLEAQVNGGT